MKTAAEFAKHLHDIFWHQQYGDGEGERLLCAAIHARDIETLEEAAKRQCRRCRKEGLPSRLGDGFWYHDKAKGCHMKPIHDLIVDLKRQAKAGEQT